MDAKEWLRQLRNPTCRDCRLHAGAKTVCLIGDGPVPCNVMLIGEAPGASEDEIGKPFVGASGGVLNQALERVGRPGTKSSSRIWQSAGLPAIARP